MELKSLDHINGILNYYKDNPECDPNVSEFFQVCGEASFDIKENSPRYGIYSSSEVKDPSKLYPEAVAVKEAFKKYESIFYKKLLSCGIDVDEEHPLFKLCSERSYNILTYSDYSQVDMELDKMIGGVSFYILQQQRDVRNGIIPSFEYNNKFEMKRMSDFARVSSKDDVMSRELLRFINRYYNVEYKAKPNSKSK